MDEKTEFIQSDDADFDVLQRMAAVVKSAAPACAPLHRIEKTGEFVINLTTKKLVKACDFCGVKSGADVEVVNLRDCRKMGHVTDFEFDECSGVIQKIIVPGIGGKNWKCLFGCDTEYAIAYQDIKQIGPDVIMVDVP